MSYQYITYQKQDGMGWIQLNAHGKGNAALSGIADEFSQACKGIQSDKGVRVILITGEDEKTFTFDEPLIMYPPQPLSLTDSVAGLDQPVIIGIPGDAMGIGMELALACDIRICTERTHFALPSIGYGLIPQDGGTQRLARIVGKGKAMEMILTGNPIDAGEALSVGLVSKILPSSELAGFVTAMAREMAMKGPISLAYAKEAVNKGMDMTLEQGLRLEADLYFLIHTTSDRTEGIKAFQEKRKAYFEGN